MTRLHAITSLLQHGALTMREVVEITGWTYQQCRNAIRALQADGRVYSVRRGTYEVFK